MAGIYPFPGNPNQTGANMPPGLATPPPRTGDGRAPSSAAPAIPAPVPSSPFARPTSPDGAPFEAPTFAAPPGTRPTGQSVPPQPAATWGQVPQASEVPAPVPGQAPPAAPPGQPPATQLAPWYWRYPVGAYVLASRMPWWFWLGAGVAVGVGGTVIVQRRRLRKASA